MSEIVKIRPYARLLTMLGEQLIKNDRIAIVELIKNSYDADAQAVAVNFVNCDRTLGGGITPVITLTDDGDGMDETTIRQHWLNPATPGKEQRKRLTPKTPSGRFVQGEKGIGRFAIFKLGSSARIITRAKGGDDEFVIEYDLSFLDEDPVDPADSHDANGAGTSPVFIDEIKVNLTQRSPTTFDGINKDGLCALHGTRLEISDIRSVWSDTSIRQTFNEVARLRPMVPVSGVGDEQDPVQGAEFEITFYKDGAKGSFDREYDQHLRTLFAERAVLKVAGRFDQAERCYFVDVNGQEERLNLADPGLAGLRIYRDYFENPSKPRSVSNLECGDFDFNFFVFDLDTKAPVAFKLDRDEKDLVKAHRIYLYRDGVRVLPYGDPEDDWLQLDVIRGTRSARSILSNDQTVGFIYITQSGNPQLRDKTNREGLLDSGHAYTDFVAILQIIIARLRADEFAKYLLDQESLRREDAKKASPVTGSLDRLASRADVPKAVKTELASVKQSYAVEKRTLLTRVERTEDLAGVGLSVEAASHDIVAMANQAHRLARNVGSYVGRHFPGEMKLVADVESVVEALSFVSSRLQDIQGLFVSTRQSRRTLKLADYVDRVARIYSSVLAQHEIVLDVVEVNGVLKVKATDAALLQVLINLFDNAVYWLNVAETPAPRIEISLDAVERRMLFSDNGPGVKEADAPYIFEPFFSSKGEDGKGLGLYIARQVGARSGFTLDLSSPSESPLSGATFVASFTEEVQA